MWKMETRKHSVRYESINKVEVYDKPTLVRDDGVSLTLKGGGRENTRYFIYSDEDRSFEFTASRYAPDLSDEWRVLLGGALNQLATDKTPSFTEAHAIAHNIRDGLLAWGWYENSEQTTARTVKFLMKGWRHWSPALGWGE